MPKTPIVKDDDLLLEFSSDQPFNCEDFEAGQDGWTRYLNERVSNRIKEFGWLIRELRKAADWSQHDLARRAGVSRMTVAKVELGAMFDGPSMGTCERLLNALNYSIDYERGLTEFNRRDDVVHFLQRRSNAND